MVRLVLVLILIAWKTGGSLLSQSLSVAIAVKYLLSTVIWKLLYLAKLVQESTLVESMIELRNQAHSSFSIATFKSTLHWTHAPAGCLSFLPLFIGMSCFYSRLFFFATVIRYSTFKCTAVFNNLSYPWASAYRQIISFSRARYNKTKASMTDHIPKMVRMEFLWRPQERKCIPFRHLNSLFIFSIVISPYFTLSFLLIENFNAEEFHWAQWTVLPQTKARTTRAK